MFLRIRHARRAIRQILAELVAWHNNQSNVDTSFAECRVQVDHVHYKKIASCRDLHFNSNANARAVHNLAFDPIHIAGNLLGPTAKNIEPAVDKFSNGRAPIGIFVLLDEELKAD
jgi:hypothetical protein